MSRCAQRIVHARYLLRSRAVTRIVAVFRGHICRHEKRLREGRREAASIVLQGGARKWHSRKAAAAARIQARARGIIGRDGLAKRRHLIAMSTRMQSCARGGLARQQMARLRLLCAAHCVVARNWRGFATRNARWQAALRKHGEWLTVAVFVQASNHERARPSSVRFSGDARASPVLRGRRACGACLRASARGASGAPRPRSRPRAPRGSVNGSKARCTLWRLASSSTWKRPRASLRRVARASVNPAASSAPDNRIECPAVVVTAFARGQKVSN